MRYPKTAAAILSRMRRRKWTVADLSDALGWPWLTARSLLDGDCKVSPNIAETLAQTFPRTTAEFWLHLDDKEDNK